MNFAFPSGLGALIALLVLIVCIVLIVILLTVTTFVLKPVLILILLGALALARLT